MDLLAGYPVLPIRRSILSRPHPLPAPWLPTPSERNVTNAPENIVRMKRGKIVTHYTLATFQDTPIGGILGPFDLAFDRGTNTLYDTSGSALFSVHCPSPPGLCTETQVGPVFPTSHMQALGFVQGVGLYGVGDNNLYLINPSSGVTTLIGFTGIGPNPLGNTNVTDLAYDSGTGRLIASVGCLKQLGPGPLGSGGPCDESNPGSIYWIDRFTGHATLLNGNAPQLMGLAEVVPEPSSALPVAARLGALLVWSLRRTRTTSGIGSSRLRPPVAS